MTGTKVLIVFCTLPLVANVCVAQRHREGLAGRDHPIRHDICDYGCW